MTDDVQRPAESDEQYRLLASHASDVVFRVSKDRRFDVDDLARSRDENRRLLSLMEQLFTRGAVLGVELDNDGLIVWVSNSVRTLLGAEPDEVVGHAAQSWVHPDDLVAMDALLSSLDEAQPSAPVELRLRSVSGEHRTFAGSGERSLGAVSDRDHFHLMLTDVTEQRATERMREELIAVASQELRDPLSFVYGGLQMLDEGVVASTDDRGRALVAKMRSSTQRLVNMVESLLHLE